MHLLYSFSLKKIAIFGAVLTFFLLCAQNTHAASLSSASATLSTSRPSASSPLSGNVTAGAGQVSIFNNGSRYLASDSAKIIRGVGSLSNNNILVASQSSDLTTVYFNGTLSTGSGAGADVLYVPITAMHSVRFTPNTTIPSGGRIVITYPGLSNNSASPSATTFAFNGLSSSQVVSNPAAGCNTVVVSSPTITCTTNAIISAGTTVTVHIGCSAQSGGSCTTQSPALINPTKSAAEGLADIWKVGILTQDNGGTPTNLDNATVAIGTIESVTVRATIDPSLTFSIALIGNNTAVNTSNPGCSQTETTNSGIASTPTEVGLGVLSVAPAVNVKVANLAAQRLTVTTNGANGYSITATSSGRLRNVSTGFALSSNEVAPQVFPAAGHFFGFHACGVDTDQTKWNSQSTSACNSYVQGSTGNICQYAWPTATAPFLIAQDTSGPIGNNTPVGNGIVSMSYAATQDVTLPPGEYQTVVTYVATPSF